MIKKADVSIQSIGKVKRLCGYNMGEWANSSYGGGAGGVAQKTFYGPYDMVYWLPDLPAP